MARLACGTTAQATAGSRIAAAKVLCNSRSEAMCLRENTVRAGTLRNQRRKRRNVSVPLDECRHGAEACDGQTVQFPNLLAHPRTVVVDENPSVVRMAREVYLPHALYGKSRNESA